MKKINLPHIHKYIFFGILIFYCAFTARYGFENWDTGYIPSFSWRIVNGQSAYENFFYKGPPLTLYFHAIFMEILPETGQFYFIRILNYLLFGLQVYLTVSGFYNFFREKMRFNKWSIMSAGFIISLLNFPPYPWPTTDGLLFSAVAFYILSRNKISLAPLQIFLVAFFCMASTLTKQSFYFIPMIFTVWIYFSYGFKKSLAFVGSCLIIGTIFLVWITSITSLSVFIDLITKETYLKGLFYAGFMDYLLLSRDKYLIAFLGILLFYFNLKNTHSPWHRLLKSTSLSFLFTAILLCFLRDFLIASRTAMIGCFLGVCCSILFPFTLKKFKYFLPILVLQGIAWCCSISMGYSFPILFSTGIILSILLVHENYFEKKNNRVFLYFIGISLCLIAYSYNWKPYRDKSFPELTQRLDAISPKLKYINTTEDNFKKLLELKKLTQKYGPKYICAPNIAIAHYIFNTESVLPADWIINTEINRNPGLFIEIASNPENYIFLEKSFLKKEELMPEKKEDFSLIASYIYRNFKKIDETQYFIIYNSIEKNEKFPEIN